MKKWQDGNLLAESLDARQGILITNILKFFKKFRNNT